MSVQPRQLHHHPRARPELTFGALLVALRAVRQQPRLQGVFVPRTLCASIAIQARDLHSAWQHNVPEPALERRISELLCDLVHLADELDIDVEDAVRRSLERYGAAAEPPQLLKS